MRGLHLITSRFSVHTCTAHPVVVLRQVEHGPQLRLQVALVRRRQRFRHLCIHLPICCCCARGGGQGWEAAAGTQRLQDALEERPQQRRLRSELALGRAEG